MHGIPLRLTDRSIYPLLSRTTPYLMTLNLFLIPRLFDICLFKKGAELVGENNTGEGHSTFFYVSFRHNFQGLNLVLSFSCICLVSAWEDFVSCNRSASGIKLPSSGSSAGLRKGPDGEARKIFFPMSNMGFGKCKQTEVHLYIACCFRFFHFFT